MNEDDVNDEIKYAMEAVVKLMWRILKKYDGENKKGATLGSALSLMTKYMLKSEDFDLGQILNGYQAFMAATGNVLLPGDRWDKDAIDCFFAQFEVLLKNRVNWVNPNSIESQLRRQEIAAIIKGEENITKH